MAKLVCWFCGEVEHVEVGGDETVRWCCDGCKKALLALYPEVVVRIPYPSRDP